MRTIRSMQIRHWVVLLIMSLLIAFGGVFGWSYGMSAFGGSPTIASPVAFILSIVLTVVVGMLILACNAALTKLSFASLNKDAAARAQDEDEQPSRLLRFLPKMTVRSVALFALIIILFWSPWLAAWFPGTMYNDTGVQMEQLYEDAHPLDLRSGGNYHLDSSETDRELGNAADQIKRSQGYYVTDAWLVDHHPFTLTLIYGGLMMASDALFGNWFPGFVCIVVFQVVVLALELSFSVAFLRRKGAPPSLCLVALLFFCLAPVVPFAAMLVMKDTAFTMLFIPYFLMLLEWMMGNGTFFERKRSIVAFVLVAVGLCLVKKTGVYVVGATALFGLVLSLIRMRRSASDAEEASAPKSSIIAFVLQGCICALLMFVLLPLVVFPALNISSGSKGEALGFMFQQTARVYADYGRDAVSPEDRQAVQDVLYTSDMEWDSYPRSVDRVKRRYDLESSSADLLHYLGAYVHMGLQFPAAYLESFISLDARYLSPVGPYEIIEKNRGWSLAFDGDREVIWALDENAGMREAMISVVGVLDGIPVLNLLLRGVTYCLWVPALMLFFCLRNRLKAGIAFVPFAMVTFFCLIGPTYDMRYLMPEMMLAPVLLGAMVAQAKSVFKARADEQAAKSKEEAPQVEVPHIVDECSQADPWPS